jgi:diguanylate cyclase (GGDEF)-like protein
MGLLEAMVELDRMDDNSPTPTSPNAGEHRGDAPSGWSDMQDTIASSTGLSVLLVDGYQPPAVVLSNNNSICRALQASKTHVKLCDPFCGEAHRKAMKAGGKVEYKCHAGLECFVMPVQIGGRKDLAVIGGRAFVTSADYQTVIERLRTGDLQGLATEAIFSNVVFSERERLVELSHVVEKAAGRFRSVVSAATAEATGAAATTVPAKTATREPSTPDAYANENLKLELDRLRNELEYRSRFADSLQHFLERISSSDPLQTYNSIITNSRDLLRSERASLLLLDENSNELVLKAAIGLSADPSTINHVKVGEGVAGEVIKSGKALMIEDVELSDVTPAPLDRLYKSKSFISYPIKIGGRKIGVLNITDKSDGKPYDDIDLSLLEIIGPQVALALERAEWQERATEFQLMSITDPLTGLPNRRYLEERLTEELNRSKRYDYPMSFLMIDIDDFKSYNDNNGHQAGDVALQIAAHSLKSALRAADVASRYGGEEFCILLPQTSITEAGVIADRIRQRVSTTHFPHGKTQPLGHVTVSIGVASYSAIINSAEIVIAAADRALYKAKSMGKDRVEFYQE